MRRTERPIKGARGRLRCGMPLFIGSVLLFLALQVYLSTHHPEARTGLVRLESDEVPMLRIFTLMKDMGPVDTDEATQRHIHQFNALHSWKELDTPKEILVFASSCDYMNTHLLWLTCIEDSFCHHPDFKRPTMNCIFRHVIDNAAPQDTLLYVNGDILLPQQLTHVIHSMQQQLDDYLLIGRRTDVQIDHVLPPRVDVHALAQNGTEHGEFGLDYWVFPVSAMTDRIHFPSFLAGVYRWDNHLLSEFIKEETVTVVDASKALHVVHQDDDSNVDHSERQGAAYNDDLTLRHRKRQYRFGNILFADSILEAPCLSDCSLLPNPSQAHLPIVASRLLAPDFSIVLYPVTASNKEDAVDLMHTYNARQWKHVIWLVLDDSAMSELQSYGYKGIVSMTFGSDASTVAKAVGTLAEYGIGVTVARPESKTQLPSLSPFPSRVHMTTIHQDNALWAWHLGSTTKPYSTIQFTNKVQHCTKQRSDLWASLFYCIQQQHNKARFSKRLDSLHRFPRSKTDQYGLSQK